MKPFLPLALLLVAGAPVVQAADIVEATRTFTVGTGIADLQDPGLVFSQTVADSAIVSLTRVEVGLHLVGMGNGFASEMYVSVSKDLGATSVLLNRVGLSGSDPVGHSYDGWDVTFSDGAANGDIHTSVLSSGIQTGIWQPDGRSVATDTARPYPLAVFNGSAGNGIWYLDVADLDLGGTMRLQSWSLTLSGDNGLAAVPEPAGIAAVAGLGLAGFALWRRRKA